MAAGLNIAVAIWHFSTPQDDNSGGALDKLTCTYPYVMARLEEQRMDTLLLQQGIEVQEVWNLLLQPGDIVVRERDEVEVVFPTNHRHYGEHFRIVDVEDSSLNPDDSRGYLNFRMTRRNFGHAKQ